MKSRSISLLSIAVFLFVSVAAFAAPQTKADDALAQKHLKVGVTCNQCHSAGVPPKAAAKADIPKIATTEACLKCHGSYKQIAERTEDYAPQFNPHVSHYDELSCYQCHRVHQTSEMFCSSCHVDVKVPKTGWKAGKNPADE